MRICIFFIIILMISPVSLGSEKRNDSGRTAAGDTERAKNDILFRKAEDHFFAGRYRISLALFNKVLETDPEYPGAYSYRGDIHLILGNLEEARENFLLAAEISEEPSYEYFRLGQTYLLMKKGSEAVSFFQESLRLKPDLHLNRFYIGLVYYQLLSDRESAVRWWKEYLKLAPDDPQADKIRLAAEHLSDPSFVLPAELENPLRTSGSRQK